MTPLGQKIKYFRKRASLSQLDVEIAIDASAGSLSRVESGEVYPSKETLLKISEVLSLKPSEINYLIGVDLEVSEGDISRAIDQVKTYMDNSSNISYLLDSERKIRYFGSKLINLINLKEGINLEKLYGKTILDCIFDPKLGIRDLIPEEKFDEIALGRINSFKYEYRFLIENNEIDDYINNLLKFPRFNELWNKNDEPEDLYSTHNRTLYFNLNSLIGLKFSFVVLPVEGDRRFEVVEYVPENRTSKFLLKLLK